MYDCPNSGEKTVVRHIATALEPSSKSQTLSPDRLSWFLRRVRMRLALSSSLEQRRAQPLELLLDEVDEVCDSPAFGRLADAAKSGLIRLIMCGRRNLLRSALESNSPLAGRLTLLRPEPLSEKPVFDMIRKPMSDLGLRICNEHELLEHIYRMTGGLPHLVQFYCTNLVQLADKGESETVSFEHIREFEDRLETAQFFLSPVRGLHDASTRAIAKALLTDQRRGYAIEEIRQVAKDLGQDANSSRIRDVCIDLVIQNVLAWHGSGVYRIANEALRQFAQKDDYFDLVEQ